MKAITLHQPWASMIFDFCADGVTRRKTIETRAWGCYYTGPLAIHAGKTVNRDYCMGWGYDPAAIPRMAVLGIVRVTFCAKLPHVNLMPETYPKGDPSKFLGPVPTGNFAPGRYGWKLEVLETFPAPINARGARMLWEWERT